MANDIQNILAVLGSANQTALQWGSFIQQAKQFAENVKLQKTDQALRRDQFGLETKKFDEDKLQKDWLRKLQRTASESAMISDDAILDMAKKDPKFSEEASKFSSVYTKDAQGDVTLNPEAAKLVARYRSFMSEGKAQPIQQKQDDRFADILAAIALGMNRGGGLPETTTVQPTISSQPPVELEAFIPENVTIETTNPRLWFMDPKQKVVKDPYLSQLGQRQAATSLWYGPSKFEKTTQFTPIKISSTNLERLKKMGLAKEADGAIFVQPNWQEALKKAEEESRVKVEEDINKQLLERWKDVNKKTTNVYNPYMFNLDKFK